MHKASPFCQRDKLLVDLRAREQTFEVISFFTTSGSELSASHAIFINFTKLHVVMNRLTHQLNYYQLQIISF
jgi:hypothetical protein